MVEVQPQVDGTSVDRAVKLCDWHYWSISVNNSIIYGVKTDRGMVVDSRQAGVLNPRIELIIRNPKDSIRYFVEH